MSKLQRLLPILALCVMFATCTMFAACATASSRTEAVGEDTGSAAGSIGDSVVAVIEWPFHVIADVL